MEISEQLQKIMDKVNAGQALTEAEELVYFTKMMSYTEEEAKKLFSILAQNRLGLKVD